MNAAQFHLVTVHFPVIGVIFCFILLVIAQVNKQEILFKVSCWMLLACAACTVLAYYSGPMAYHMLDEMNIAEKEYIESHAVLGQASFVLMTLLGVAALSALAQYWQEEIPSQKHRWAILIATAFLIYIFAWTAHLGGLIRHPEIRTPEWKVFPHLK